MRLITLFVIGLCLCQISRVFGWSNGPPGNAQTDTVTECGTPPYATHDWIPDHALAMLPQQEKAWFLPHKTLYLALI
jgi:hypothetical protein